MVSLMLVVFGSSYLISPQVVLDAYPALGLPYRFVALAGLALFTLVVYTFPDGRFVPRWAAVPTARARLAVAEDSGAAMSGRNASWPAWSLWALTVLAAALALFFVSFNEASAFRNSAPTSALILAFSTVGALVASRRPGNAIGVGGLLSLALLLSGVAELLARARNRPSRTGHGLFAAPLPVRRSRRSE